MNVTIAPTDEWMADSLDPIEILKRTKQGRSEAESLYRYLLKHGMYRHDRGSKTIYESMKKSNVWQKFRNIETIYKKKWNGPDVPVYLLPVQEKRGLFQTSMKKSGVCFKDEIYLFLTEQEDRKEYEALFVHEYHHCTRMARLDKEDDDYTLMDSIVFEGLAEHAVKEYCGEEYVASWTKAYGEKELQRYYDEWIRPNLDITRINPLHDHLLLGQRHYPKMLGYAAGYFLVKQKLKDMHLTTRQLISKPSSYFMMESANSSPS
ncbi:DUF2268 domain-containing protein [Rossellomorea aquimaris]|uniref:DUF2268 domain-containing protein n=1 Tax=Rossellomorea aquimaris TaxID=189382 RepID=UPI001CD29C52|nr:DUF2268 domain-containing putative Zn-dependent protease [Rossellomorea aquimaris]MCA1056748.1 DUF2268 domain-containing protein [Rossellomorea aquimaris]